ncbi:MAG: radical SAM protein [Thermoplasmatales archaeon]|nr:MAG: radical SAM protein [Thermoplasmatales archaeon]
MTDSKNENTDFRFMLNDALKIFFKDAKKISIKHPSQALYFFKTYRWQKKASKTREKWEQQGTHVPPIMIFSITHQCNLNCKGCYEKAIRPTVKKELTDEQLRNIIKQSHELGISFVVVAGGEPFMRPGFFKITEDYHDIIFTIFTNGLLINDKTIKIIKTQKNIVPLISLEGCEEVTDERRGKGIYNRLQKTMEKIKDQKIFFGTSLTLTKNNFDKILNESFIQNLIDIGCKFFLFLEYNPIKPGTEKWMITDSQRERTMNNMRKFRAKWPALSIAVPGDEEEIGGCLAAGRGFIHISAEGDVEPCPFAPYSDMNLNNVSLKEALNSDFLKKIREKHAQLHETGGSCALWEKREMVQSLLRDTK